MLIGCFMSFSIETELIFFIRFQLQQHEIRSHDRSLADMMRLSSQLFDESRPWIWMKGQQTLLDTVL